MKENGSSDAVYTDRPAMRMIISADKFILLSIILSTSLQCRRSSSTYPSDVL